jgi:hypothetical protein
MFKGLNAQCPPTGETIIDIVTSDCETFEYVISNTEGDWDGFTFALYNFDQENCMPIGLPSNNQVFPPFDPPVYEPGGQWSHAGPTTACMNNGNWGPVLAPVLYKQKWLVDSAIVIQGYNEAITCDPDGDFVDFFIPQELGCKSIDSISTSKQSGDYFDCGCTNVLGTIHYSDGTSYDFDFNVNLECDIDVDPPVCNIQDRVFQGMIGESVEIDVNALAQSYIDNQLVYDACGDVSFSIAMNIATDQPLPDTLSLACGESIDAMFFFTDESGYDCSNVASISVECESDVCDNALNFSNVNDYVEIEGVELNTDFTLGFWFKAASSSNGGAEDRMLSFGPLARLEIGHQNDGSFWIYDRNYSLSQSITIDSINVRDNQWHHVIFATNGGERRLYYDFELIHSYSTPLILYSDKLRLGDWGGSSAGQAQFTGSLDDVRIYGQKIEPNDFCEAFVSDNINQFPPLFVHFDFEDGIGGGDNSMLSNVKNDGIWGDGELVNFELNGNQSNFICDPFDKWVDCIEGCFDNCETETLQLSTGLDVTADTLLELGNYDPAWLLVDSPDSTIQLPRPAFILIDPHTSWDQLEGSNYISAYTNALYNADNLDSDTPYEFERCFCICEGGAELNFDIDAHFDNSLRLTLEDNDGNEIIEFFDVDLESTSTFLDPPESIDTTLILNDGKYCFKAYLKNAGSQMGMSISIDLHGEGLIEHSCCSSFSAITGSVFLDENCDTLFNADMDYGLKDFQVKLRNSDEEIIDSILTDSLGYFTFYDIPPGNYSLQSSNDNPDYYPSTDTIYLFQITENSLVESYDFGYCFDPGPDPYDTCSVAFDVEALTCSLLSFDGAIDGFQVDSLVEYSYTISNGAFTSLQQDTTIDFTGFFGKEEICLEATDGACTAVFCDSIDLFQPFPPLFEACPDSVKLEECIIEIPIELFGDIVAIEPCDFTPLNVTVTRSDSLELTAPYTLGETTLTAVASAYGLQSECTWTVELIDTFPPICLVKDTVLYLDEMGQAFLTSDELDLDTDDNCTPVIFNEAFVFDCSMTGDTLLSFMISDTLGNTSQCESTISILPLPRNIEIQTELIACREYTLSLSDSDFISKLWTISRDGNIIIIEAFDEAFDFTFPGNGNYTICVDLEDQNGCRYKSCIDFPVDMECDKCLISFETLQEDCYLRDFESIPFEFRPEVAFEWSVNDVPLGMDELFGLDLGGPGEYQVCLLARDLICEDVYCESIKVDTVYAVFGNCPDDTIVLSVNQNCDPVQYTSDLWLSEFCNKGDQTPNDIIYTRSDGLPISAPYELGVTEIYASFTDYYGIESTCDYTIEVVDEIAPVCHTVDIAVALDGSGTVQIDEDMVDIGSYDNCELVSRSLSQYEFTCDEVGEQNVDLILSDGFNESICPVTVFISDEDLPTCEVQSTTLYLDEMGQLIFSEADLNLTVLDNCGIGSISLSNNQLTCMDIGDQQVLLTTLDVNGNEAICEVPLMVLDTISPVCEVDSVILFLDESGQGLLRESAFDGHIFDNCDIPSISLGKTAFDCMDLGSQLITNELFDNSGNTSSCTLTIVVRDTISPVLEVLDIEVLATSEFGAVVDFEAIASDNCGEVSITYSIPSGEELACGEYDILATATDPSGNQQSRSFKVNVIECEACCLSENVFNQVINQGFSMEAMFENGAECMAQLFPPDLTDCQVITRIKWGDGTLTTGEFPDYLEFTHEYLGPGSYEVCVTIAEALEDYCFEKEICGYFQISEGCSVITRIEELDKEEVILVPNPAKDRLRILSNEKWTSFQVFDLKGSVYQDLSMSENEIDLSKLESGLYYIRLINNQQSIVKAFVKTD